MDHSKEHGKTHHIQEEISINEITRTMLRSEDSYSPRNEHE